MAAVELQPYDLTREVDQLIREMVISSTRVSQEAAVETDAPSLGALLSTAGALAAVSRLKPTVDEGDRMTPAEIMDAQEAEFERERRKTAKRFLLRSGV